MALCSILLNDLSVEQDVHGSKNIAVVDLQQDGFELHSSDVFSACQITTDPFESFCLLPDPFGRLNATTCSFASQTDQPNSLFERLVRGEIKHPDDLPSIWESANLPDPLSNNQPWISVQDFGTE